MAWQRGRTKTKRKARNERVMGKDGTDIFILYQTVVTWKTRLIIRPVSTYFSPELWPLRAGNLHRLSGNVRLCTIKFLILSFFLSFFFITYILWFNLSICPSSGEYFFYTYGSEWDYIEGTVYEKGFQKWCTQTQPYTINKAETYWCCPLTTPVW